MQEWITRTLETPTFSSASLLAAFLLGLLGAMTPCCSGVTIGAIAGYSGSVGEKGNRRDILLGGLSFMLGTILALVALGAIAGLVSQTAGATLGKYWKIFAGFFTVLAGLACLRLLPFDLSRWGSVVGTPRGRGVGALAWGLAIGGGAVACTACCNPALFVVLGMTALQGRAVLGIVIMAAFAVGYSLPLAAAVVGLSLGFSKATAAMRRLEPAVRATSGVALIAVGFYLLATI